MAALEGNGAASVEHALAQLAQDWAGESGNDDHDRRSKRQRTQGGGSPYQFGGDIITANSMTTPEVPWSLLDSDAIGNGRPTTTMPILHLPPAAIEPERDAQHGARKGSSSTSVEAVTPATGQKPSDNARTDLFPQPFGWQASAPFASSPLMLERLSPFLVGAGTGYATSEHAPHPSSPQHHPYSWGDTPMHTGASEEYAAEGVPAHEIQSRSTSEGSHVVVQSQQVPEPAVPLRRQASHGSVKGKTLWEERHGLISPWNVLDDHDDEYPSHGVARSPVSKPMGGSASSTWIAREDSEAEEQRANRPREEKNEAAMSTGEGPERPHADSWGIFEDSRHSKRVGPEFQAVLPELREWGADGEEEKRKEEDRGAILVWSTRLMSDEEEKKGEVETEEEAQPPPQEPDHQEASPVSESEEGSQPAVAAVTTVESPSSAIENELSAIFQRRTSTQAVTTPVSLSVEADWTEEEEAAFEEGITAFRKNFAEVQRQYVPSKTVKDVVAYFYRRWKLSPRYPAWKKDKLLGRRFCNRQRIEGTITSYRELYDGTAFFRVFYDDGHTEELYRWELEMGLLRSSASSSQIAGSIYEDENGGSSTVSEAKREEDDDSDCSSVF